MTAKPWLLHSSADPAAQQHGLPHKVLSPGEVERRFPGYHLPSSFQTMYEPEGGFLVPEKCIAAQLAQAQHLGAHLLCGAKVQRWRVLPAGGHIPAASSEQGGLVQVGTSRGTFTARRLVLAAGAWMPQLVPQLAPVLKVERQVVGWFDVAPDKRHLFSPEVRCAAWLLMTRQPARACWACLAKRLSCVTAGLSGVSAARRTGLLLRFPCGPAWFQAWKVPSSVRPPLFSPIQPCPYAHTGALV